MPIEVVIYQVGARYAWTLQERMPGLNQARIMSEGVCVTFRAASEEAGLALRSYKLREGQMGREVLTVSRGHTGGWHWSCTCGSFGWSYNEIKSCPGCKTYDKGGKS